MGCVEPDANSCRILSTKEPENTFELIDDSGFSFEFPFDANAQEFRKYDGFVMMLSVTT